MAESWQTVHNPDSGAWRRHDRRWRDNRYVYAVVSRRSHGVSVGVNLNPDKTCNFACMYCQVNRQEASRLSGVDLDVLAADLERVLEAEREGSLYEAHPFNLLGPAERGVRDIAFSGDGEPTTFGGFEKAIRIAADARRRFGLERTKLVLITNASCLRKTTVRAALEVMDENNGEIWAKLDAGTEEYFRLVNRTHVPFDAVLKNILDAALVRPVVIQTLWFRVNGELPPGGEIGAYCGRLNALIAAGGQIKAVQLHTIARDPSDPGAVFLTPPELDTIATRVRLRVPTPLDVFYGAGPG